MRREKRLETLYRSEGSEQILDPSIIPKRAADVGQSIHVAWTKHETAAKLKRILPQLMLTVAGGPRAVAGGLVVAPEHVQQVRAMQAGGAVGQPLLVDQQRECYARIFPELARVVRIAESDGRQVCASLAESLLVCAQLRDVLAAEDSTIVAEENYHGGLPLPKRAQPDWLAVRIGENHRRKGFGEHL